MILDQYGNKIVSPTTGEPQTSRVAMLRNELLDNYLDGLSPGRLIAALMAADRGDFVAQHRIFSDMEERDAHLYAEICKRRSAPTTLPWRVVPPKNPTTKEKADAEWLSEMLQDAVDSMEDLILSMMDAIGQGFSAIEITWRLEDGQLLPGFQPVAQEWFQMNQQRTEIRLRDMSMDGAPLDPFGWIFHANGKAKTGYLGRMGLYRVCVWPFLYKAYGVGDFAEFLETYGLPIITGKYTAGATKEEKDSLWRAVTQLGHNARAIMPQDMTLEINKITGGGENTPHMTMIDWSERSISKAILGQVLSAEAKATGLGSGVADLQKEVREDILRADARQIAATLTRDLAYPMLALNRGADSLNRSARIVLDIEDLADFGTLADGLPKLVGIGMTTIPLDWVHSRLGIPTAKEGEATLAMATSTTPATPSPNATKSGEAALSAKPSATVAGAQPWAVLAGNQLATEAQPTVDAMLGQITTMLEKATSLEEFAEMLLAAYPQLEGEDLTKTISQAIAAAQLKGRLDVSQEAQ